MVDSTIDEAIKLHHQLCFALYSATHAITRSYRALLAVAGLTYPQYLVVLALMERPSMTSGDLARELKLDPGTLTPLLKRLASAGFIARERRLQDERIVDIKLTERGWALQDTLCHAQRTVAVRTSLGEEELGQLRSMLHTVTDALSANSAH